jgi:thioredoxin 1
MIKIFEDNELRKDLAGDSKLYIYFYSPSCGPCKITTPLVKELGSKSQDIIYILNSKEGEDLQKQLNVTAYPSLIVIKNNKVLEGSVGYKEVEKTIQNATSNK